MKIWLSRLLIGIVLFFNIECAISFIIKPEAFTWGFELSGETGEAMIRGLGVLFLMWNVPYAFAVWNPIQYRISLYEAILMQGIGVIGESLILMSLTGAHPVVHITLLRFIAFDTFGLVGLMVAAWITRLKQS
jgi:hypothetical protein